MPITRIQSPTGITSRGPTAADAGFDVTLQVRQTVISSEGSVQSTVDDRNIATYNPATVDTEGDIDTQETVIGTLTPYLRYESLDPSIATVDSVGNVTRVSNGTARILVKTRLLTKRIDVPVSRETGQTVITLDSYVTGSLARECSDAIDSRIAGLTPAVAKPLFSTASGSTYVRNTGCWASDIDLTCVSAWSSVGNNAKFGITAISPLHGVYSRHANYFGAGTVLHFVTNDGTLITRTVTANQPLAGSGYAYDLSIVKWDSDLPASITPAKVLPSNVLDYLPSLSTPYSIPCLTCDYENKATITELHNLTSSVACHQPADATRLNYYESLISGDSGRPCFLIIDGELVLVTIWTFGGAGSGPRIHALHTEINAAMTTLGGGYQLTVKSLSAFTDYS